MVEASVMNKLQILYFITDGKVNRLFHTEFTKADLHEWLETKFKNGDLPCPIEFSREEFNVKNVTVTNVEL